MRSHDNQKCFAPAPKLSSTTPLRSILLLLGHQISLALELASVDLSMGGLFCCVQDSQCAETWDCTLLLWARPLWQVLGDCKSSPHTRVLPPSLLVQAPCAEPWGRVFGLAAGRPLWLGLWCGTLGVSSRLGAAGGSCVALGGLGCRVLLGNPRLRRWCSTAYREHPKNL